jgi:methionyl-tRNA formyltransferase
MTNKIKLLNSYGPIAGILLIGGGQLLRKISLWSKSKTVPLKVITSPRHAAELQDGLKLSDFLIQQKIDHLIVEQISDLSVISFVADTKNYFYLSLGAAWIFKSELIVQLFNDRLFNLHSTRLPQNRGGGGFSWQIMMGNKFGFCVLHRVDGGVDTGDIIAMDEFIYPSTARIPRDYETISLNKNFNFIIKFIEIYQKETKPIHSLRQSDWLSTYWPRLHTELNGFIDWNMDSNEIEKFICAFDYPYKGASTFINDTKVFLRTVSLSEQEGSFHSFQTGLIYRKSNNWVCVAVKGATLIVEDIRDQNNNNIFSEIKIGDRFYTPQIFLESAMKRPIYTSIGLKKINI